MAPAGEEFLEAAGRHNGVAAGAGSAWVASATAPLIIGITPAMEEQPLAGQPDPAAAELIRRCPQRDEDAWQQLIGRYGALIYSVARRYGLDEDDAADVFQSVCMALWEGLGTVREGSKLASWLITVTARIAWRRIRETPVVRAEGDGASSWPR